MSWIEAPRRDLLDARTPDGAWPYRPGGEGASEPTALAALALLATAADDEARDAARAAAAWLVTLQRPDGAVGVSVTVPGPTWPTAHALLLWSTLDAQREARERALAYLLSHQGRHFERTADAVSGHDTAIVGWPWIGDTHSWIEPTALALLALQRAGHADHPRAVEGRRMIVDRALPSGGWNYGNTTVFGTELRPHPAPSGMALLALAGHGADPARRDAAATYLERLLPQTRAPMSLSWGLLGLAASGRPPPDASDWLSGAVDKARHDCLLLSLVLLAAGDAMPLLGIKTEAPR